MKAIKEGNLYLGYDAKFLFGEVNGLCVNWTVDNEGNMTPLTTSRGVVGKYISTKAVNTISRDDVTSNYKFSEGNVCYRLQDFCMSQIAT